MKRVIHFSGGKTSAYMSILLKPTVDDVVLFTDTGREHHSTYQFIDDFEKHEGIKVHRAAYSHKNAPGLLGFDALIAAKRFLPNRARRICTEELKVMTARKYLRSLGLTSYHSYIGFRYDEQNRIKNYESPWKKVTTHFLLNELKIDTQHVSHYWSSKPYTLKVPRILGNCDACFLKGFNALVRIEQAQPGTLEPWAVDEENMKARIGYATPTTYIKGVTYRKIIETSKCIQTLFPLEDVNPQFSCTCNA